MIQGDVLATREATITTGNIIDYFVVSKALGPAVGLPTVITGAWRPHFGLILPIYHRPRELMITKLCRQPKLPLAMGPDLPWHVFEHYARAMLQR